MKPQKTFFYPIGWLTLAVLLFWMVARVFAL